VAMERHTIHVPDVQADSEYNYAPGPNFPGMRAVLGVPLLRGGEVIGVIVLFNSMVKPFTQKQIALVTTFANQALIAIENTRLFEEVQARTKELTQALEQQTATSEVLGVISSSPGELQPVFQALLKNAVRICEAKFGTLYLCEADGFRAVAMHNAPLAYQEERRGLVRPPPNSSSGRAASTKKVVQIVDIKAEQGYISGDPFFVSAVDLGGFGAVAGAPMHKEVGFVEIIGIFLQEVRAFFHKQIEHVIIFAKQGVIAIETPRPLNARRKPLQRQPSTADVLKVI